MLRAPRAIASILCLASFGCGPGNAELERAAERAALERESEPARQAEDEEGGNAVQPSVDQLVLHGVTFPVGALSYATGQHQIWRGITSEVTWIATREDVLGLIGWMSNLGASSPIHIVVQSPGDPGVPAAAPSWAGSVLMIALKQEGEACLPCFDPVGRPVTERGEGCRCE